MPRVAVRMAILDALLLLDAMIDSADLAPHLVDLAAPAVAVLLARHPEEHHGLLTGIFEHPERHDTRVWLVAGNLLSRQDAPGVLAGLLGRLTIHMEIEVRRGEGPYLDPAGGITDGHGFTYRPDRYPPLVAYELRGPPPEEWPSYLGPRPAFFPVADGPRPIHAERVEAKVRLCHTSEDDLPLPEECIAEWIAERLKLIGAGPEEDGIRKHRWWRRSPIRGVPEIGPPARPAIQVRWAGAPPLLRQTKREHELLEACYWEAVRQLLEAGLLTREEASGLRPKISFVYSSKSWEIDFPLPAPPEFPVKNPWYRPPPRSSPFRVR
jgi:hypothetical protein